MMPMVEDNQDACERDLEAEQFAAAAERAFNDLPAQDDACLNTLSVELMREFEEAELLRQDTEDRWLKDLRQFRGMYDAETLALLKNRSKAFVRRTRVKVNTTDARMMDYLFPAGQEKNWTCDTTPKPSVADEVKQQWGAELAQKLHKQPQELTQKELDDEILARCKISAKGMSQVMEDQIVETRYKQVTRKALHSGNLYGTGVIKGPLVERKVRQRFMQQGDQWQPQNEEYLVPFVEHVPLWRFYPDMAGGTDLDQLRFVYELHLLTRHQMAGLISRKTFDGEKIKEYLEANPRGLVRQRQFISELKSLGDRDAAQVKDNGMYEVLERWGWLTGDQLCTAGIKVEEERRHESFFTNVWMLPNGEIIKAVVQPINGVTWPYHLYYFDKDETSIFGEGLAAIMRDDQEMLNAAIRMMLDNGALTAGPMLEIAIGELTTLDKVDEIHPWKIWLRKNSGDLSKPAIRQIQLENNLEWLSKMAALFEQNTDEVTAIPRYMTGENSTTGAAGTASGMSMLMGAANIVIKELLNSWDEGVTRGFIQSLYRWNMQFNSDNSIKGDFDVKARGTASLIAKEVQAQQLNNFANTTAANPQFAPFVKPHALLKKIAEVSDMLDVIKSDEDVEQEKQSDLAKKQEELAMRMREAQVAEMEGKAAKLAAEAEVAKKKLDEMMANIEKVMAETQRTQAEAVDKAVQSIFAALQAGGVATRDPLVAPAGDEILKSAGFVDKTPQPTIAQLDGPPVQPQAVDQRVMGKGETFAQDPRLPTAMTPAESAPGATEPAPPIDVGPVDPETATGHVGERAGIETTRIEQ